MPELPEVQTVVNHLARKIRGKVFGKAVIYAPKMVNKDFAENLKNKKVQNVSRRGKMIIIDLAGDSALLVHLKMTGQLVFIDNKGKASGGGHPINSMNFDVHSPNRFTRIILNFKDKTHLLFHDIRKFGWMRVLPDEAVEKITAKYGVEPLSKEFTLKHLTALIRRRPNLKIKQFLLAQELIAGIGNIYADESLFAAKIKPMRQAKTLKSAEIKKLHQAIISKLKEAVKYGGTSVNTFVSATGQRGRFADMLKVYQRGGQKCGNCRTVLSKAKIGGRGTVYCARCQK